MKNKKVFSYLLILAICVSLCGCGKTAEEQAKEDNLRNAYRELIAQYEELADSYLLIKDKSLEAKINEVGKAIEELGAKDIEELPEGEDVTLLSEISAKGKEISELKAQVETQAELEQTIQNQDRLLTIENNTDVTIYELFIGDEEVELLKGNTLAPGQTIVGIHRQIELSDGECIDSVMKDEEKNELAYKAYYVENDETSGTVILKAEVSEHEE